MKCTKCGKKIAPAKDFYFICDCGTVLCGDCGIDADLECPECGGMLDDKNEEVW